jgi:hypothetical protein
MLYRDCLDNGEDALIRAWPGQAESTVTRRAFEGSADGGPTTEEENCKTEGKLHLKKQNMDKAKVCDLHCPCCILLFLTGFWIADIVRRYSYRLGQTEMFKNFVNIKAWMRVS